MDFEPKSLSGTVFRKSVAQGSKSERDAVMLRTADGEEYILRRRGGNAFADSQLDRLVGSSVTAQGQVSGQLFIVGSWNIDDTGTA